MKHHLTVLTLLGSLFCPAATEAATIEVSASATHDLAAVIQKSIDGSAAGDTIHFAAGIYAVTNNVVFKADRQYVGEPGAVIRQLGSNHFAAITEPEHGADIRISGLGFENYGIMFAGSGHVRATNVVVTNCFFKNITSHSYPFDTGIYIPIGATRCDIVGNTFSNIMGDNAIAAWSFGEARVTDNYFDTVNEGAHLNDTCPNVVVARNTGVRMHRMGFEFQGHGHTNLLVEDNHFSNWKEPYMDSFGLSIANAGTNILVRYNTLLGRPPTAGTWTGRFGFGIEVGHNDTTRDNFVEGYFWHGIVIGGKYVLVTNNVLRGPANGTYQDPASVAFEPGSDPALATITSNIKTVTASYIENPDRLRAVNVEAKEVQLAWADNSDNETGFKVERRVLGGAYGVIADLKANITGYTDASVDAGTQYVYRIHAYNQNGDETYSPVVLVTTPGK